MLAVCPGDDVVEDQMILRLKPIALRSAACESIEHDDFRARRNAPRRSVLSCDEKAELIYDGAGEHRFLRVKELVFTIAKILATSGRLTPPTP